MDKILTIIPAVGWSFVHEFVNKETNQTEQEECLLVAWALVEDEDGYRYVIGLSPSFEQAAIEVSEAWMSDHKNYLFEGKPPWKEIPTKLEFTDRGKAPPIPTD
jgi:hypothetical protein